MCVLLVCFRPLSILIKSYSKKTYRAGTGRKILILTRKSKTEAVLQRRSMLKLGVICKYMKRYGKC